MKTVIILDINKELEVEHDLPLNLKVGSTIKLEIPETEKSIKTNFIDDVPLKIIGIYSSI